MSEISPNPTDAQNSQPSRDHKRTTVRFTDEEFERIKEESRLTGESIPKLLRVRYFQEKKLKLLMGESDRIFFHGEFRRIGNNVNQIARRVNSGALEGWHPEFKDVVERISEMCRMMGLIYGAR